MIPGLELREDFVSPGWEVWLLKAIELSQFYPGSTADHAAYPSFVARYGSRAYGNGVASSGLPKWAQVIRAMHPPAPLDHFDHVTLNYYAPGDGFGHHIDALACGSVVGVISLGSDAELELKHDGAGLLELVTVPARSLLTLAGEARWEWTHAIRPVEKPRISVVLRRVGRVGGGG